MPGNDISRIHRWPLIFEDRSGGCSSFSSVNNSASLRWPPFSPQCPDSRDDSCGPGSFQTHWVTCTIHNSVQDFHNYTELARWSSPGLTTVQDTTIFLFALSLKKTRQGWSSVSDLPGQTVVLNCTLIHRNPRESTGIHKNPQVNDPPLIPRWSQSPLMISVMIFSLRWSSEDLCQLIRSTNSHSLWTRFDCCDLEPSGLDDLCSTCQGRDQSRSKLVITCGDSDYIQRPLYCTALVE